MELGSLLSSTNVGIHALKKKGLRPMALSLSAFNSVGIHALKKKGLRPLAGHSTDSQKVGIHALKKKGLRQRDLRLCSLLRWNPCLKKKGLRRCSSERSSRHVLESMPEEEGIKTWRPFHHFTKNVGIHALRRRIKTIYSAEYSQDLSWNPCLKRRD